MAPSDIYTPKDKAIKKAMSEDVKKARSFNRKVRFNSRKEMDLTEYVETFNLTLSLGLKKYSAGPPKLNQL